MSALTVTSTPQPVYPDGFQEPFIIYNDGPYKIFVDENTSISTDSLALAPKSSIPWDAQRPLYVMGIPANGAVGLTAPTSRVVIQRNSQLPNNTPNIFTRLYSTTQNLNGGSSLAAPLLDVSPYATVQAQMVSSSFNVGNGNALDPNKQYYVTFSWYSDDFFFLGMDQFSIPAQAPLSCVNSFTPLNGAASRIQTPVRGTYVQITAANGDGAHPANVYPTTLAVSGSTIASHPMQSFTPDDHIFQESNPFPLTGFQVGSDGLIGNWAAAGFFPFILPSRGQRLQLAWSTAETIATAGKIRFTGAYASSSAQLYPDIALPAVAAGASGVVELDLPDTFPVRVSAAPAPKNGGGTNLTFLYLALRWLDYP